MQLRKIVSTLLGTLTAVGCIVGTAGGAQAASNVVSGVALGGSFKGTSTYLPSDPAYGAGFNYHTYLINSLKGRVACGVNLPTVEAGVLPDLGGFQEFQIYYDVPGLGPAADPGLSVVIQTADGFTRIANVVSSPYATFNNYNVYQVDLLPTDFSPSFNVNQTALRLASVRYNGSGGAIYMFYPVVVGQNGILENSDFAFKTNSDFRFNSN
ncbi:MAG: hypothetical protein EKK48_01210 [Candidatus Melainabacteria bacterium]|nr:MAG: hypothetical protein EKK48_01210 [Candidatus Melainabacteria bacterium]